MVHKLDRVHGAKYALAAMLQGAVAFNQDISSWNVSSVDLFDFMLYNAYSFNADISRWDTTGATVSSNLPCACCSACKLELHSLWCTPAILLPQYAGIFFGVSCCTLRHVVCTMLAASSATDDAMMT